MNKAKGVSHPCYKLNLLKNQTSQSTHRRTEGTKSKEESQSWGWTLNWLVLSFTLAVQWHEAQFASYIIQAGSFICTVLLGCMNSLYNWHLSLTNIQKSNIILLKYFILCVSTENRDLTKVKLLVSLTAGFIVEKANFTQPYHWWSRKLTIICKQLVVCDCIHLRLCTKGVQGRWAQPHLHPHKNSVGGSVSFLKSVKTSTYHN